MSSKKIISSGDYTISTLDGSVVVDTELLYAEGKVSADQVVLRGDTSGETTLKANTISGNSSATFPTGNVSLAAVDKQQTYTAGQSGNVYALTDGANIAFDFALSNNFSVTLQGSRNFDNPTNVVAGQSGIIAITQGTGGNKTLTYSNVWAFSNGNAPTLSNVGGQVDLLVYYAMTSTKVAAKLVGNIATP